MRFVPRTRRAKILVGALIAVLVLVYAPTHRWEDEYHLWERDETGTMVEGGDGELHLGVVLDGGAGKHEIVSTAFTPAGLRGVATRRIWFLDLSGARLVRETAVAMQRQLKDLPYVQETAYFPRSYQPLHESTLPDLFVTLELCETRTLHLPGYLEYEHVVRVGIGHRPLSTLFDTESFRSGVHAELVVTVRGKRFGLTTAAFRHERAAEALAGAIDLSGRLADWRTEHGALAGAPEALIAAERALPELPLSKNRERREVYRGGYFLLHAEALWLEPLASPAPRAVAALAEGFEAAGWTHVSGRVQGASVISLEKGPLYFEAFVPFADSSGTCGQSLALYVQERYTAREARALLERHVRAGASDADVQLFLAHVPPALKNALDTVLEREPVTSER